MHWLSKNETLVSFLRLIRAQECLAHRQGHADTSSPGRRHPRARGVTRRETAKERRSRARCGRTRRLAQTSSRRAECPVPQSPSCGANSGAADLSEECRPPRYVHPAKRHTQLLGVKEQAAESIKGLGRQTWKAAGYSWVRGSSERSYVVSTSKRASTPSRQKGPGTPWRPQHSPSTSPAFDAGGRDPQHPTDACEKPSKRSKYYGKGSTSPPLPLIFSGCHTIPSKSSCKLSETS